MRGAHLTICMGSEPLSLLPYLDDSYAARLVRAALFGTGIDAAGYTYRSGTVQHVPSLADGSAVLKLIRVAAGDVVLDDAGEVVRLTPGVRVRPTGCRRPSCAVTFTGALLEMDQLMAVFELRPDLVWSDGAPVVADDSVFSFELASNPAMPHDRVIEERTESYGAIENHAGRQIVVWTGLPGFLPQDYATTFWTPLPSAWRETSLAELLQREDVVRVPPSFGPYSVASWEPGDAIRLVRNLAYAGPQSAFEEVVFRFIGEAGVDGIGCDLVAHDLVAHDGNVEGLETSEGIQDLSAWASPRMRTEDGEELHLLPQPDAVREHLVFNVGTGRAGAGLPLLADLRMRRAIAICIDRAEVTREATGDLGTPMDSYVPPDHPLYTPDASIAGTYAPGLGADLLEQVGWDDADGDGIRESSGVAGVPDGTPLRLRYVTAKPEARRAVAAVIARQLADCGIALDVVLYDPWELYAQSATGVLASGAFDLAQTALLTGVHPDCEAYATWAIPAAANDWTGQNFGRYSNAAFDTACAVAGGTLPGEDAYPQAHRKVQALFGAALPALPLYRRATAIAVRADLTGVAPDPLAVETWNIAAWGLGGGD